jgi:protein SCO1
MVGKPTKMRPNFTTTALSLLGVLAFLMLLETPAGSHDPQDLVFDQVGVEEQLGQLIPAELYFQDQTGRTIQLASYFTGEPVILTLNYYACPTLCPLVFRNLAQTLGGLGKLSLGKDFRIVTVSINPDESPALAREKSAETYAMLSRASDAESNWPFLRGTPSSISRLAQSVGVRYTRLKNGEFAHPNVLIVVTPERRISRYLYGLEQRPQDLKLALIEATDGKIGASRLINQALLYCFHYDPVGRKYVLFASRLMTVVMLGVLTLTAGLLLVLWKREKNGPAA